MKFATELGVSEKTLASYERGETKPDSDALAAYREKYGVSLEWLVAGEGSMFADPSKVPTRAIDDDLMLRLARLVERIFRDEGARVRDAALAVEAARAYNSLLTFVDDLSDSEALEEAMPLVERRMRKRLSEAAAQPGTGKREAS